MHFRKSKFFKVLAVFTAVNFLAEIIAPATVYALTTGPSQPEFDTFRAVTSSGMVDAFTGGFNYNLPVISIPGGADGGGYALSLAYTGPGAMEQEASWVGLGWTLNAGAVNRDLRGYPDDYNGQKVKRYNKSEPNWTITTTKLAAIRLGLQQVGGKLEASKTRSFNNHAGYSTSWSAGVNVGVSDIGSAGFSFASDAEDKFQPSFSVSVNPMGLLNKASQSKKGRAEKAFTELGKVEQQANMVKSSLGSRIGATTSGYYGVLTFNDYASPVSLTPFDGYSFFWGMSLISSITPAPFINGGEIGSSSGYSMQFNKYLEERNASGFMYAVNATDDNNPAGDYHVEKDNPFQKGNLFIGMPFSSPDNFHLSGEGIGGSFRAFQKNIGHYRPGKFKTTMNQRNLGMDVYLGMPIGVGLNVGVGSSTTKYDGWEVKNKKSFTSDNYIFRFNGDPGGSVRYQEKFDPKVMSAELDLDGIPLPGMRNFKADADDISTKLNTKKAGSTTHIDPAIANDGSVEAFTVYNPNGVRYKYGVPVMARNETMLSVNVRNHLATDDDKIINNSLVFRTKDLLLAKDNDEYTVRDIALKNTDLAAEPGHTRVVGEIRNAPYASTYLISEITSPEYIDRTNNGPSDDDFGGYTKFDYRKKYGKGTGEGWYRWRHPYAGLNYERGMISNKKDDNASLRTGEKEMFYLDKIETKTHVAYFVTNKTVGETPWTTGSGKVRLDARSAAELSATGDPAALKSNLDKVIDTGVKDTEYLEKIVLFSKNPVTGKVETDRPIKITHFEYDYSLCRNVPNNVNSTFNYSGNANNLAENSGKLTLRKVYEEYNGTVPAEITPYEFIYSYAADDKIDQLPQHVQDYFAEYASIPDIAENPLYTPDAAGPWGYPRANAAALNYYGIPFIQQDYEGNDFDPAAYHLKRINLPSGGSIHIQYEQNDYRYVQNLPSMVMARLVGYNHLNGGNGLKGKRYINPVYYVDPAPLGAKTPQETQELATYLTDYYFNESSRHYLGDENSKMLYFKFLYSLKGGPYDPTIYDCEAEYINGYTRAMSFESTTYEGKSVLAVKIGGNDTNEEGTYAPVPREACYDFYVKRGQGKVDADGNSDCIEKDFEVDYKNDREQVANDHQLTAGNINDPGVLKFLLDYSFNAGTLGSKVYFKKEEVCKKMSPDLSFIKLPMMYGKAKKGGGVRVKRTIVTDNIALEAGDNASYGTEYFYVDEEGNSSGVALNEPVMAREENPLVHFLKRGNQKKISQFFSGINKDQVEGPIGESVLPGASVSYSRVVAQSINNTKARTGFTISEFHTCKDFPVSYWYGQPDDNSDSPSGSGVAYTLLPQNTKKDFMIFPLSMLDFRFNKRWATQGFRFILNDMHGKPKKSSSHGGVFTPGMEENYAISHQKYTYHKPGTSVKMWTYADGEIKEYYDIPGWQEDVTTESKRVTDNNIGVRFGIAMGANLNTLPVITAWPKPIWYFSFQLSKSVTAQHATTQVIRVPSMLKEVESYADGIYNKSENVVFSGLTGGALVTKTTDGFHGLKLGGASDPHDGSYYSASIPAAWMYPKMGKKSDDVKNLNRLNAATAVYTTYGVEPTPEWFNAPKNVLSVSVSTYRDKWGDVMSDKIIDDFGVTAQEKAKINEFWKPYATYAYLANDGDVVSDPDKRITESGYFDMKNNFNWQEEYTNGDVTDKAWIQAGQITQYAPTGFALEEKNALDMYSTVKFEKSKYGGQMPTMTAANADHKSIWFEDYEGGVLYDVPAHSGKFSKLCLSGVTGEKIIDNMYVTDQLKKEGAVLKLWLYSEIDGADENLKAKIQENNKEALFTKIARTGEWTLYETELKPSDFAGLVGKFSVKMHFKDLIGNQVRVDDVRFQPMESEAVCYVYDAKTLRLVAQFDDQHFGVYFYYDMEGKLISKKIETERGMKAPSETQYHTPTKPRK